MKTRNQKEGINVKFRECLGIYDYYHGYPEIDEQEKYKVKDIQGPQAQAERDILLPYGREIDFNIDNQDYFIILKET